MPAPRGTAIQIGNLPGARTVSAKAQLDATAARLRAAEASGDPNEMLAALQASTSLDLPDGVAMTPELQKLTATMRQRIGAEPGEPRPKPPSEPKAVTGGGQKGGRGR